MVGFGGFLLSADWGGFLLSVELARFFLSVELAGFAVFLGELGTPTARSPGLTVATGLVDGPRLSHPLFPMSVGNANRLVRLTPGVRDPL